MISKGLPFVLLFFLSNLNVLNAQVIENIKLNKVDFNKVTIEVENDSITFLMTKSKMSKPKPVVVFLQGSLPIPIIIKDGEERFPIIPFNFEDYLEQYHFVLIARKGIPVIGTAERDVSGYKDEEGKVPDEYINNDNLYYRTFQAQSVINYLRNNSHVLKDSIYVVGHSEGYRIAAKLGANSDNGVAKLVCMSADPFNRSTEMIFRERIKCFTQENDSLSNSTMNDYINNHKYLEDFKKDKSNSSRPKFMNWYSYESELAYKNLEKFNNPIMVVYGTNDIGSSHNYLLPYLLPKNDLTLKSYPDYGHNYEKNEFDKEGNPLEDTWHWDDVFKDVSEWLLQS